MPIASFGAAVLALSGLLSAQPAAGVTLTQVSTDPFTNASTQHATEVEPDIQVQDLDDQRPGCGQKR